MRAEIKSYYADESVGDPSTYQSRDANAFGYALTFSIGPIGQAGADNFEVIVTTPKDCKLNTLEKPLFSFAIVC